MAFDIDKIPYPKCVIYFPSGTGGHFLQTLLNNLFLNNLVDVEINANGSVHPERKITEDEILSRVVRITHRFSTIDAIKDKFPKCKNVMITDDSIREKVIAKFNLIYKFHVAKYNEFDPDWPKYERDIKKSLENSINAHQLVSKDLIIPITETLFSNRFENPYMDTIVYFFISANRSNNIGRYDSIVPDHNTYSVEQLKLADEIIPYSHIMDYDRVAFLSHFEKILDTKLTADQENYILHNFEKYQEKQNKLLVDNCEVFYENLKTRALSHFDLLKNNLLINNRC